MLEERVRKLQNKNNFRIERMKRFKDLEHPKFNEFDNGKVWGAYQAYSTVLGIIKNIKRSDYDTEF